MKDFDKFIFKGAIKIKPVFPIRPNPKLCQIWKRDLYEIRLSLLCGGALVSRVNNGGGDALQMFLHVISTFYFCVKNLLTTSK